MNTNNRLLNTRPTSVECVSPAWMSAAVPSTGRSAAAPGKGVVLSNPKTAMAMRRTPIAETACATRWRSIRGTTPTARRHPAISSQARIGVR